MTAIALSPVGSVKDVVALTKPRITVMAILVAMGGMALAPVSIEVAEAVWALLGIALLVSGSSSLNMFMEREWDALMARTKDRPLPAGRMAPMWALVFGLIFSGLALPALYVGSNWLTFILGFLALVMYVLVYTPLKRVSSLALVVGAVPGAMPALLGYTAVFGRLDWVAWSLFGVAFFWQLPHFIAISIFRQQEYTAAGYPVVPSAVGLKKSKWLILFTTLCLVASSFGIWAFDAGGMFYLGASTVLGAWFLAECGVGFRTQNNGVWARRVFWVSLIYQTLLFLALAIDVSWQSWQSLS